MVQSYKGKKIKKDSKISKVNKENKIKEFLNKNKIVIIIVIILLILVSSGSFAIWFKTYNEPTHKLKRYLANNGYTCSKSICRKTKDNVTYSISYKKDSFQVLNEKYTINISQRTPYVVFNDNAVNCTYDKDDYEEFTLIDDTFSYDKSCSKYIDEINKNIKEYKNILSNARVTVDDFSK